MKGNLSSNVENIVNSIHFLRIDGKLCYSNGYYYVPLKNKKELEAIIFQRIPRFFEAGNINLIKKCAEVIFNYYPFPDVEPAEKSLVLGFNNLIALFNPGVSEKPWQLLKEFPVSYDKRKEHQFPLLDAPTPQENGVEENSSISPKSPQVNLDRFNIQITHLINASIPVDKLYAPQEKQTNDSNNFRPEHITKETLDRALNRKIGNVRQLGFPYNQSTFNPYTPQIDLFISQIAGNDPVLIERIWEVLACILVPDPSVKFFFLLQGVSDSGKSVFGKFITSLFYKENVRFLDLDRLGDRHSSSVLPGAYLNVSMDLPDRTLSAKTVATLKMLTGDDEISIEGKSTDVQSFKNRSRFLFGSNYSIRLSDYDEAFIKRLVTIPFRISVDRNAQDPYLFDKLYQERDYIVWKAVGEYYPKIKGKTSNSLVQKIRAMLQK